MEHESKEAYYSAQVFARTIVLYKISCVIESLLSKIGWDTINICNLIQMLILTIVI